MLLHDTSLHEMQNKVKDKKSKPMRCVKTYVFFKYNFFHISLQNCKRKRFDMSLSNKKNVPYIERNQSNDKT